MTTGDACQHCQGSGQCAQWCCKVFGNGRRIPAPDGRGTVAVRVCMICQGTGAPKSAAAGH